MLPLRLARTLAHDAAARLQRCTQPWGTRSLHERRPLPYDISQGLGSFLPPDALKAVAVEYQEGLLQRLNDAVRGTGMEYTALPQTIIQTAGNMEHILAYNYASLALNNSFFLGQLTPPPPPPATTHQAHISNKLRAQIRLQYGSMAAFKSSFAASFHGMFFSGWIWLVSDKNGNLGIIPTMGAGTLLIRSRQQIGYERYTSSEDALRHAQRVFVSYPQETPSEEDAEEHIKFQEANNGATPPSQSPTAQQAPPGVSPSSPVSGVSGVQGAQYPLGGHRPRFVHATSAQFNMFRLDAAPASIHGADKADVSKRTIGAMGLGETMYPLFCIPVYEHAWMSAGYGVWGKTAWLKQFWSVLDWKHIDETYAKFDINLK